LHEFSLINDLIRKITVLADQQSTTKVLGVKVKLGAFAHISPVHFREHFEEAAVGTVAEGARLKIETNDDETDPHAQDILLDSVEVENEE